MFIMLSNKPRKNSRNASKRYRAKLKAKNSRRRAQLFSWKASTK